MKKLFLISACLVFSTTALFTQTIIPPVQKNPISFGIFIDTEAFLFAEREVLAYRDLLESEGRSVYIVHHNWTHPEQVREEINKIYRSESAVLEGIVLVGNIPIVLVRDFQHTTTAFKADYRNPHWSQPVRAHRTPFAHTSVPSDRFFDDPYLQFRFLGRFDENPLHFYYSLLGTSRQTINSPFFSARIFPSSDRDQNRKEYIRNFLTKVVRERQIPDPLDNIVMFNGPAYNSDCLTAWFWMQQAHKEHFPNAFQSASTARFLNFRSFPFYKFNLFTELQREEVDVFMFHKHGLARSQLISNGVLGDNLSSRHLWLMSDARRVYRRALELDSVALVANPRATADSAANFRAYFSERFGIDASQLDNANDPEIIRLDSLRSADRSIFLEDVASISPMPRFILFDACNNGEFTLPGYIAGYYIFNDGRTIVGHANTVNVLQDKWTEAHLGLLSLGVTVGEWSRLTTTLEAHLFGDPTVRFASNQFPMLYRDMILRRNDVQVWENYLKSGNPAVMAIALRHLYENNVPNLSDRLLEIYKTSPFLTVRKQCLHLLSRINDENFITVLQLALYDPYEKIRRRASIYVGKSGRLELLPAMMDTYLSDIASVRVNRNLGGSFSMFPYENLVKELNRQIDKSTNLNREEIRRSLDRRFARENDPNTPQSRANNVRIIMDKDAEHGARRFAIQRLRNSNFHEYVPQFVTMLADDSNDLDLRITMAEALGWFNLSYQNPVIVEATRNVLANAKNMRVLPEDEQLKERFIDELTKTINRLTGN